MSKAGWSVNKKNRREGETKRGRRSPVLAALAALLAAGSLLSGCGGSGKETEAAGERGARTEVAGAGTQGGEKQERAAGTDGGRDSVVVVMTAESEPESGFDPAYGWGAGEHVHEPLIQSTLTVTTPDLKIGYDLAEDMQVSEDGLTWTVKIRDGVNFSDGVPLTAGDVAFTYNTLKETSSVNDFTMLDRAEASGRDTAVFHMKRPYSIWPYTMAITGIVPEHAYGPDYGSHPVGSGRYLLKQWDKGQQVIFEANPDYYGETPKMKTVTVLFMDEDAAFAAVKSGQADLAYTAASYADQKVDGFNLLACETVDNRGLNLPAIPAETMEDGRSIGNDFTADVRVRQALNLGIDRDEMIQNVLNGYGSPAYSVCDKMPWYNSGAEIGFAPEEAERLLKEAGWLGGADGIREKDGEKAVLEIAYPAGDSVRQALAADTANQLKKLGIDASAKGVGWDTAYDDALSQPLVWGWGAHTPMELYNIYHTMADTGLAEYSPYANPAVDAYMDEALAGSGLEASYELWKKAQWDGETGVIGPGDIPWIWLVNIDHLYWQRDGLRVAQQKLHPHGHGWSIVNNVDQWEWN